jgi:hypothetical protein
MLRLDPPLKERRARVSSRVLRRLLGANFDLRLKI